jgi:hypothetical protein
MTLQILKQCYWDDSHRRFNASLYAVMRIVYEWLRDAESLLDIPITLILQGQAVRKKYNSQKC